MPDVNNTSEIQQLRMAVQELGILNEIATAISGVLELDQVVDLIVQKCIKHLQVEQCAVMLLEEEQSEKPFQTMVRKVNSDQSIVPYHFGVQLSAWMLKHRKPLLVNDFERDQRFHVNTTSAFPVHSLLSVPLQLKGQMIGLLNVFNKQSPEGFTPDDQRLLTIIATQSAQVIENARLYQKEITLSRIEEDLQLAREIQRNLLPKSNPQIPGYEIVGRTKPAREVGGDYYDFIPVDDATLAFCLGDISGKGIAGALLMSNLQATLRGQTGKHNSCAECLKQSNMFLYQCTDILKFATLFYGVIDTQSHQVSYSKAGHIPPMLVRSNGDVQRLEAGGTVLGFLPDSEYKEETIRLEPGDLLIVFSDGITEAYNADEDPFDEERLYDVIQTNKDHTAVQLMDDIISEVKTFTGQAVQQDDMTLLIVRRLE